MDMKKTIKKMIVMIFVLAVGVFFRGVMAADLFECNWNTGSGSSTTSVRSGVFSNGGTRGLTEGSWEVFADDGTVPGGRSYLRVRSGPERSDWIYGHNSFGNPQTLYVRFWMRVDTNFPDAIFHPMLVGPIPQSATNEGANYICRLQAGSWSMHISDVGAYKRGDMDYTNGQWYRVEYKVVNNVGSTDSIEVMIDGVDVTDKYNRYDSEPPYNLINLADENGFLDISDNNYLAIQTYTGPGDYDAIDFAGLKVTDGPDWIGGDGPLISSINQNNISHGESVTISGNEFGVKDPANPIIFDDFEKGFNEGWLESRIILFLRTSDGLRKGSSFHARANYQEWANWKPLNTSEEDKWYWSYYMKLGTDWIWNLGCGIGDPMCNVKYFQFDGFNDARVQGSCNVWDETNWQYSFKNEIGEMINAFYGEQKASDMPIDTWFKQEFAWKNALDSNNTADGRMIYWYNGNKSHDQWQRTWAIPMDIQHIGWKDVWHTTPDGQPYVYYDDVYIDNTWARVMIGDNSDFNNCHKEIQIPTAWSNNSITINVNRGSFSDGKTVYLFVIDEDGGISNGYPISFTGESPIISGDLNNDGAVNIKDIQLCINVILGTQTTPEIVQRAKEVVEPLDECNELDLQIIINIILNQ